MKIVNSLKLAGLLIVAVSLSVGCAGTTEPEAEPEPTPAPEPMVEPEPVSMSEYTVVRGDSLWAISAMPSVYGNPYQWPLIYKANSDQIKDADLIYPGQVLGIDNNPSATDIDAAVRHARTRGSWSLGVVEDSDRAYLAQ
ncbi:MAG: LysM peptidoglycan-binding domain-containing protein [Gammaproteobacteria bacterium]|nr:LysM peptidoglycan-binding domain-containing protein [Gammaproteobacteria bacterium]NIR65985.1 LysM peptidoglycan-binding domain-containing protein [candidate division Zixibacteria bacterium]NIU10949.1 LysM peptidoglycan-binding domain-containing protein [Phycisphaerae bacterium]NIR95211.1 LysM peptidoglycan-binding domain-containing protein [Gammaproteobacteria bacterium]NIU15720.1 LysM peptidoglycan-binding domain-containing protein [candidate division Zixibacteria bacterium]